VQTCIWPSWCHCHSLSLASVKSRFVLPFWYRLTRVVLDKGPLNRCVCVCVRVFSTSSCAKRLTVESYTVVMLLTFICIRPIISIPSHPHSFIPRLKLSFLQILPTVAFFFFFRTDYYGFPGLFTDTSEHIRNVCVLHFHHSRSVSSVITLLLRNCVFTFGCLYLRNKLLKNTENVLYVSCSCFLFLRVLPVTNCTEIVHAVKHKVFSVTSKNIVCNVYIMRKHNFNNTANPIVMVLNFPVLHFHRPHRWLLS